MSKFDFEEEKRREQLRKELEELKRLEREKEIKESLETIGNSILSGLASISSVTADVLESAVEKTKESNEENMENEAARIRRKLELRQRQKDLKEIKKIQKERKKAQEKAKGQISVIVFLTSFFILGWGPFVSIILLMISNFIMDRMIESGTKIPALKDLFGKKKKEKPQITGPAPVKETKVEEEDEFTKILKEANKDLDIIYRVVDKAEDREISQQATKLYERGIQILDYLKEHPEKMAKSGRFLNYYLDTASKICDKYMDFAATKVKNEDINEVLESTKRAMILLEKAFDNEFLKLMEDDIVDIEADIKVLENSMKWDNYID